MNETTTSSEKEPEAKLPFSKWLPLLSGVAVGLIYRLIFNGSAGDRYSAMMITFIFLAPVLVGMVTVYVAERQSRRSWTYCMSVSTLANFLFIAGTLILNMEGIICALLSMPLFMLLGIIGGVLMGAICRFTNKSSAAIFSFAALPLLFGSFEHKIELPVKIESIERRTLIDASPDAVWKEIWNVQDIQPNELDQGLIYRIGVPLPKSGITVDTPEGLTRKITMGKNIHFNQVVTDYEPNQYVNWHYQFSKDSFPPHALDDHVTIGGRYFDLESTSYTLTPHGNKTELKVFMQYRISTQFNWYAEPIANILIGNFEEAVLDFYKHRSEKIRMGS